MKVRYNILTALLVSYVGYTYQATAMSAISPSVPVAPEIPDDSIHEPGGMIPLDHHPMVYGPDTTSARQTPVGSPDGVFQVSPTGAASYSINIDIPKGRHGMEPRLAVTYNSQGGNGVAGWGFELTGTSAIRCAAKDLYHDNQIGALDLSTCGTYMLDGTRMVLKSGVEGTAGAIYTLENDPFTEITVLHNTSGNYNYFRMQTRDGKTYTYGYGSTRDTIPSGTYAWHLRSISDALGNTITYSYATYSNVKYLTSITYGGNTITLAYSTRPDNWSGYYAGGYKYTLSRRLSSITAKRDGHIYRKYTFGYNTTGDSSATPFSRLETITETNGNGEALEPLVIDWNYLPGFGYSHYSPSVDFATSDRFYTIKNQRFFAADMNGDGLSDIVQLSKTWHRQEGVDHTHAYVYFTQLNGNGSMSFDTMKKADLGYDLQFWNFNSIPMGAFLADFDGDGLSDLCIPSKDTSIHDELNSFLYTFMYGCDLLQYGSDISNNETYYFAKSAYNSSSTLLYAADDFDNDGRSEIFHLETNKTGNVYKSFYFNNVMPDASVQFSEVEMDITLPHDPTNLYSGDFNSDGLADIVVFYDSGCKVYLNNGCGTDTIPFSESNTFTTATIAGDLIVRQGDFNGDGAVDFIINKRKEDGYYFLLCEGDGTFNKVSIGNLNFYEQVTDKDDDKFAFLVTDFDHDGRSDLVLAKPYYDNHGFPSYYNEFIRTYYMWFRSTGTSLVKVRESVSYGEEDACPHNLLTGDFDGDGWPDIMSFNSDIYTNISRGFGTDSRDSLAYVPFVDNTVEDSLLVYGSETTDEDDADNATDDLSRDTSNDFFNLYKGSGINTSTGKVKTITDGFGNQTRIRYATLPRDGVYDHVEAGVYPVINTAFPLNVVSGYSTDNGAAGNSSMTFRYTDLKIHTKGRGLLGFTKVESTDSVTGTIKTLEVKSRDIVHFEPVRTLETTARGGFSSTRDSRCSLTEYGNGAYKVYLDSLTDEDIWGNITATKNTYNRTYGYITQEHTTYGSSTMYRTTLYNNYSLYGSMYLPARIIKRQRHADATSYNICFKDLTYNSNGLVTQLVDCSNDASIALTTHYQYDSYGNVTCEYSTGNGISTPLYKYYGYSNGRDLVSTSTEPRGEYHQYTLDELGNVLSDKLYFGNGSDSLVTRRTYDGWGNLLTTLNPDGTVARYRRGWGTSASKLFYTIEEGTASPFVKTWYDSRGREVRTESAAENHLGLYSETTYNSRGLKSKYKEFTSGISSQTDFAYDALGRLSSETSSTGSVTTYIYGNRTTTVETDGKSYTKEFDAWGNVKTSSDPVSSVSYTYASVGKPSAVTSGGSTVSITYNKKGNRTRIIDPDAGTTNFTYDALGRMLTKTDPKGTVSWTYDAFGRPLTKNEYGGTTVYTYGTQNIETLRLMSENSGGYITSYTYDSLGRVTSERRETREGDVMSCSMSYNSDGLVGSKTFPNGITLNYTYDLFGYKTHTHHGSQCVWRLDYYDGKKRREHMCADSIVHIETLDQYGNPLSTSTYCLNQRVDTMTYSFDPLTGNMLMREDVLNTHTFTYDDLDRLTSASYSLLNTQSVTYSANGNILSKTGVGSYTYGTSKPHAVTSVSNPGGVISDTEQNVYYTGFGKASVITEDGYSLYLNYGPDHQRWKTILYNSSHAAERTTLFFDEYEQVTTPSTSYDYLHLDGGLIYIKRSGRTGRFCYRCTDNLGSVRSIVSADGQLRFLASYDAWGKQDVGWNTVAYRRGYTGHEMLPEFGLVNMNGRLYDPDLGRFLSPDDYVQIPDLSQSFNRYSYCLNNPLKYTDPSGESFIAAMILGAAIGTYIGGALANDSYNPAKWDFSSAKTWGYMYCGGLLGAASGYVGAAVSSSGLAGANTLGLLTSSAINSLGTHAYTLGSTPISISLGAVSYDFTNGEFGYLGKKGNSTIENIGYSFGAMANLPDFVSLIRGGGENIKINSASTKGDDHEWWGHSSATRSKNGQTLVSVGPDSEVEKSPSLSQTWRNSIKGAKLWKTYLGEKGTWSVELNNISTTAMSKYASGITRWDLLLNSCVGHTTRALWCAGVPTIYAFHPHMLNLQLVIRQVGIYSSPFLYQFHK
ncbi:MAG: VCBS repeat-containing protein [Bacteroidaceae bacterium]|nr:VCBS repeat-containing protein [Bacteroidaceae bacterium]